MSYDTNADLVGFSYKGPDGLTWKVTGTPSWSSQYVHIETTDIQPQRESCVLASLLRGLRRA